MLLDDLLCQGDEETLLACQQVAIGSHTCNHSDDAGVRCEGERLLLCTDLGLFSNAVVMLWTTDTFIYNW